MLDVSKLLPLISSILGESREYSRGEYYFYCPFCNHYKPKLAVNLQKGKWHCWTCDARGGRLTSLLRRLSVTRDQINELRSLLDDEIPYIQSDDTKAELRLPMEYQPIWKPTTSIKWRHAVTYLRNRNITAHDILRYEIGFCEAGRYADRIIIPSFDAAGKLNYFTSRAFFDGMQSYLNPPISRNIVGFENQINWKYPVTLVEGAFDAMAVKQNAIPMFGKILTKRLIETLIDKKVSLVNLALDADALKDVLTGAETLMHHGIAVNYVHLGGKDPSSLGYEEVRNAIKNARLLDFSTMVELKMKV